MSWRNSSPRASRMQRPTRSRSRRLTRRCTMFDLRRFLSRSPIPDKLKITNHNGEEQIIQLPPGRKRWANVEETVRTSRAQDLQLLNDRGEVIRAKRLSEEESEGEDDVEAAGKHDEKII